MNHSSHAACSPPAQPLADVKESNETLAAFLKCAGQFLDSLHFPIAIINSEGRYVYYNDESAEIDGCSKDFALNNLLLNVYPKMRPEDSTMLTALHTGRSFVAHPQRYYNARGKLLNYMHTTTPLFDKSGRIMGAIEIGWDISQTEKLQKQVMTLTRQLAKSGKGGQAPENDEFEIVTRSPIMERVLDMAKSYARTDVPVVILGESGTGKELIAEYIYRESARKGMPFVKLNCGALTESLIDSSLFGTVKGAFTGAENTQGYLEFADGGTLFLDEFNSVSLPMQVKLLRFLQDKTFSRVGSPKIHRSNVRIIAAMNESPRKLIDAGRLRSDLYWRLSVAELELPPLRARLEDIPILVRHFMAKYASDMPYRAESISPDALAALMKRPWPGNIRMLENVVVRSMALMRADGPLERIVDGFGDMLEVGGASEHAGTAPAQKGASGLKGFGPVSFDEEVQAFERRLIAEALEVTGGNIAAAAEKLGMNRTTLSYKVKKLGIARRPFNPDA